MIFGIIDGVQKITHDEHKGMATVYPERYEFVDEPMIDHAIFVRNHPEDRVALITCAGGGSGPLGSGFVDEGLADAGVTGDVNAAPSAYSLYMAAKHIACEKGVLFIYNNYMGDYLNNDMAAEMLNTEGMPAMQAVVTDNMGSAPGEPRENRNGLVSLVQVLKAANAASRAGLPMEEIKRIAEKVNSRSSTLSTVLDPEAGKVIYGAGFAGEPPLKEDGNTTAKHVVKTAVDMLLEDLKPAPTDKLYVIVNVLRMVTYAESYAFANRVDEYLEELGFERELSVGNFFCANNEPGYYITILAADEEIQKYMAGRVKTDRFIM